MGRKIWFTIKRWLWLNYKASLRVKKKWYVFAIQYKRSTHNTEYPAHIKIGTYDGIFVKFYSLIYILLNCMNVNKVTWWILATHLSGCRPSCCVVGTKPPSSSSLCIYTTMNSSRWRRQPRRWEDVLTSLWLHVPIVKKSETKCNY